MSSGPVRYELNLLLMHWGVISSLHGPVALNMLSSWPGSTGFGGLHFPLPFPFPFHLPPFLALPLKSPVKWRRPTFRLRTFSSRPPDMSLMPGVM